MPSPEEGELFAVVDPVSREFIYERRVLTILPMNDEEGPYFSVEGDDGDFYDVRWIDEGWVGEKQEEDEIEEDEEESW